jgi:hypothetical protein
MLRTGQRYHDLGGIIVSTAGAQMLGHSNYEAPQRNRQQLHDFGEVLVSTAGIELLSGGDEIDDLLAAGGTDLLFGNELLFGGDDLDALFGADIGDPDLAALSSVISGSSDLLNPVDIAGLDIIGATNVQKQAQLAKAKKAAQLRGLMAAAKKRQAQQRLQGLASIGVKPTLAVDRGFTKARGFPFALKADAVTLAGAPGSVTRRPQVPIKIKRLVIPSSIASAFDITDIKVGKDSQLVGSDPIPGETFSPTAFGVELNGDTAQVGNDVSISFVNISGAAQQFRCVFIGPAVE